MDFYRLSVSQTLSEVKSSEKGLTSAEAQKRLEENGKNKLKERKMDSVIKRFFKQMADPMILILLAAAIISAITTGVSAAQGEFEFPWDVVIILFVVIVNAILGVVQEGKAEKAIEALQEMAAATAKVLRDGKVCVIKTEDLVVGDVVILEAGDAVPADCRLIEASSLKIEEAALTGESVPVTKEIGRLADEGKIGLGDRTNMAYQGSNVVYGRGIAVITATGMDTEMGKIADAIDKAADEETPLQKKLDGLSKVLTWAVIGICVFIFAFQLIENTIRGIPNDFSTILDFFMIAVSLAVAAIPEGLVAVVTIVLSMGVTKMSQKNAIIRKLTAVETLGCTQVICSDKTGTLTQNKMTVVDKYCECDEKNLASMMSLCTDVHVNDDGTLNGEPTELALVNYATSLGLDKNVQEAKMPRIGEAPFDSMRKMMSTVHNTPNGITQFTKGAPDVIITKCKYMMTADKVVPLTDDIKEKILYKNKEMADKALRVLACAMKIYREEPEAYVASTMEKDLVFVGLVGMIDPVRPEVKSAIHECRGAGITPVMITGDHKDTAVAIAKELEIITDESQAMTGAQLEELSDEEFDEKVTKTFVYARVQPEHKTRIVNAWKKKGYVTAMTGDGVNDAPSIKAADIGVGMGITGTDVTKNVADMVLADDNFATIVNAVAEGRRIYDNIRKAIQFLLSSNLAEVILVFIATMLNFVMFKPTHLLWINLVTDCFPALALGIEKHEPNIMRRKPRRSDASIFSDGLGVDTVYQGLLITLFTLFSYFIGVNWNHTFIDTFANIGNWTFMDIAADSAQGITGMTMAFLTLSMCEMFHSFNMRSQRHSIFTLHNQNWALWGSLAGSFALTALVIEVPAIANIFDFANLDIQHYLTSICEAILIIPIVEIIKAIQRSIAKKKS
jgi:Ca2+-transporting ATPase